jgi:hypothetical protein
MKALLAYAGVTLVVVVVAAGVLGAVLGGESARAVWLSAVVAYAVQVVAFGILLVTRDRQGLFLVGMVGGMGLRLAVLLGVGLWVTRTGAYPAAALLLSLAGFLFLLLLLEPAFMRRGSLAT